MNYTKQKTDFKDYDNEQLHTVLRFAEAVANRNLAEGLVDSGSLEQAKNQAEEFCRKRNAGLRGKMEIEGDAEIKAGVRNWLRRTGRIKD